MIPPVLQLKSIWHDSNPSLGSGLYARLLSVPGGPVPLMYLDGRLATRTEANGVRQGVGHVGLYFDPHWFQGDGVHRDLNGAPLPDPIAFRKLVSSAVSLVLESGDPVMFDWEKIPSQWLREFLWGRILDRSSGWRGKAGLRTGGVNPFRPSAWTDCSFQAPNWATVIPDLVAAGFVLSIQLYYGGMQPVEDKAWAILEPVVYGYPGAMVKPFYDAAAFPSDWHTAAGGCLFTTQRLAYLFGGPVRQRFARLRGKLTA